MVGMCSGQAARTESKDGIVSLPPFFFEQTSAVCRIWAGRALPKNEIREATRVVTRKG